MRSLLVVLLVACGNKSSAPTPSVESKGSATTTTSTLAPGIELPVVALQGYEVTESTPPAIGASLTQLTVGGKDLFELSEGRIPASELDEGALGLRSQKLVDRGKELAPTLDKPGAKKGRAILALDRRLPYRTMIAIMYSLKQPESGITRFGLRARTDTETVMTPLDLPERTAGNRISVGPDKDAQLRIADVTKKINSSYVSAIKRCYKDHLEKHGEPSSGKLVLRFTVDKQGKARNPQASGFDPIAPCVTKAMATWRFKSMNDESFEITLALVPDDEKPPPAPAAGPPPPPPPAPPATPLLQMVVSITDKQILVWSFSTLEGTFKEPSLAVDRASKTALEEVGRVLREIVDKRFPGNARDARDRAILLVATGDTPIQAIAELAGAVRRSVDGKELFPDVMLSTGFE